MKVELTAPKNFSEMSEKQLRYLCALLVAGQTESQIHVKCFVRFTGIKIVAYKEHIYFFKKPKTTGFFQLTDEQVASFASQFKFLTSRYEGIKPFERIGLDAKPYERLLRDTNFATYFEAENSYQAYIFKKDENYLVRLLAVLYQTTAEYILKNATAQDRIMCLMWFIGIKEYFAKKWKYLFKKDDLDDGNDDEPVPPNMFEIITNQVRILTQGDITKNKLVLGSPTWDALTELDNKCREYEQLKKQSKNV